MIKNRSWILLCNAQWKIPLPANTHWLRKYPNISPKLLSTRNRSSFAWGKSLIPIAVKSAFAQSVASRTKCPDIGIFKWNHHKMKHDLLGAKKSGNDLAIFAVEKYYLFGTLSKSLWKKFCIGNCVLCIAIIR